MTSAVLILATVTIGAIAYRIHLNHYDDQRREAERSAYNQAQTDKASAELLDNVGRYFPFLRKTFPKYLANHTTPTDALKRALVETPGVNLGTAHGLPVVLPRSERRKHVYCCARSGFGKTSVMTLGIFDDLQIEDQAMCVIVPETELFRDFLLPLVPPEQAHKVIYWQPGNADCPIAMNGLQLEQGQDRDRGANELFLIFCRALGDAELGARMKPILSNCFTALMGRKGCTLWDIKRLLQDEAFRSEIIDDESIDEYTRDFFANTFPSYPKDCAVPLLGKLDAFLRTKSIRRALCNPNATWSIDRSINTGCKLFIDLGSLDPMAMQVLGSLILAKIQLTLMHREHIPASQRKQFSIYVDEFQTVAGTSASSWAELLSRGRRYGAAIWAANQHPDQLPIDLWHEISGNVSSLIIGNVSARSANVCRRELLTVASDGTIKPVPIETIVSLKVGQAVCRLGSGAYALETDIRMPIPEQDQRLGEIVRDISWRANGVKSYTPTIEDPNAGPQIEGGEWKF